MENSTHNQIIELIQRSNKILVLPSSPPDGDSIGSAVALYLAFKKLEKDVTVICSDAVPDLLHFLPNIKVIGRKTLSSNDFIITVDTKNIDLDTLKTTKEEGKLNIILSPKKGHITENDITFNKTETDYDLIITVDCGELEQIRDFYENNPELFHQIPVINIDHHISNSHFGKLNYVDIMASSTTELLLPLLEDLAVKENTELIDEDIATLLLTGIITDTGSFQNANTTPKAFAKAAKLVSYGARQQEIIQHVYKTKQLSQLKLWGRVLSKIQTDDKHRIVWSAVSQQDFRDTESSEEETGDIIDELMTNAPGAEVVLLMKERGDGVISCSLRTTNPSVDASKIAEHFGGGGHTQAAGFRMSDLDLREAEYEAIQFIKEFQKSRLGIVEEKAAEEVEKEPMIDVEKLIERVQSAEQAQNFAEDLSRQAEKIEQKVSEPEATEELLEETSEETSEETKEESKPKKTISKKSLKLKTPPVEKSPAQEREIEPDTSYTFED